MVHASSSSALDGPTTYVLAVGVADFKHLSPDFDLRYAEADASAFTEGLATALGESLPRDQVTVLVGRAATLETVSVALRETLAAADEDDTVILFFSTHGVLSGDEGYLLTWDTTPNERLPYTSLPTKDIVNAVNRSRAAHVLLFTDACHAGITGAGTKGASVPSFDPSRIQVDHRSFFNQASSTIMQPSLEGAEYCGGHGAYTCALLMAMQGEVDRDSDGSVSLRELQIYVPPLVDSLTNGQQSPETKGRYDSQHVFVGVIPNSNDMGGDYSFSFADVALDQIEVMAVGDDLIGTDSSSGAQLQPSASEGAVYLTPPVVKSDPYVSDGSELKSLSMDRGLGRTPVGVMHRRNKAALLGIPGFGIVLGTAGHQKLQSEYYSGELAIVGGIVLLSASGILAINTMRVCRKIPSQYGLPEGGGFGKMCRPGNGAVTFAGTGFALSALSGGVAVMAFDRESNNLIILSFAFLGGGAGALATSLGLSTVQHLNNARLIPGVSTPGTSSLPGDPTQPMWAQAGWSPMGLTVVGTF